MKKPFWQKILPAFWPGLLLLLSALTLHAAQFTNSNITLPFTLNGVMAVGDYDNDGRLDLAITGISEAGLYQTSIYHNDGGGNFSLAYTNVSGANQSTLVWVDLDNDGRLDLVVSGTAGDLAGLTQIWRNTGSGFVQVPTSLPGTFNSAMAVGDFDNDGLPDLLIGGGTSTTLFRNLGHFGFTTNGTPTLPGAQNGDAQFADFDNDGWPDVALGYLSSIAITTNNSYVAGIFGNQGGTNFNLTSLVPNAAEGRMGVADFNNDGRLDIGMVGQSPFLATFLANTGGGVFTPTSVVPVSNFSAGFRPTGVLFGDFDNAGLLDVVVGTRRGLIEYLANQGNGIFSLTDVGIATGNSAFNPPVAIGDLFGDGRLAVIYSGDDAAYNRGTFIYRNTTPVTNTPPTAPGHLFSSAPTNGARVILSWTAATDAQTPALGLTYNLRVGTVPGGCDIVSPQSEPVTGHRRVFATGNAGQRLFAYLQKLPINTTYYWSVQAVDGGLAGGPWAPEATFSTRPRLAGDINGDGIVDQNELRAIYASYLQTSPYLTMTNTAGLGSSPVTFSVGNDGGLVFRVLTSTNLTDWQYLGPATTQYLFNDVNAGTTPTRYYRLTYP